MEIEFDASIKSEVLEREDTPIGSQDPQMEPQIGPYQFCLSCGIPRNSHLVYSGICVYCMEEKKYCIYGDHEEGRPDFVDKHGNEHVRCNHCRDDESTGSAGSSHETEVEPDDDLSQADESQMKIYPQVDNDSEAGRKTELEVRSELDGESRMDIDLHVDTGAQTDSKPWLRIESQLNDEPIEEDKLPLEDDVSREDELPFQDELAHDDDLTRDDEPQSVTETNTQNEVHFSNYETEQIKNDPAIQVFDVKPELMASIDMNCIPRFGSSSVQGMGNFFDPFVIDSD